MTTDVLRWAVVALALLVSGSALTIAARYVAAAVRLGRAPGRILARHVAEVSLGVTGLAAGYAWGTYASLTAAGAGPSPSRTGLYLISMLLLLVGVVEVGRYQRLRATRYPQRQQQVRHAVRGAMEGHPVSGPRSADYVAVLAANAVLRLDGTPALPEPTPVRDRPNRATSPADTRVTNPRPRHARREEPR